MSMTDRVMRALSAASRTRAPFKRIFKAKFLLNTLEPQTVYFALSTECVVILNRELAEIDGWSPVYYSDIEYILSSEDDACQMLFQVLPRRRKYPSLAYMFWTRYSAQLVEHMTVLWTTDNMAKTGAYVACPIIRRPFLHPSFDGLTVPDPEPNDQYRAEDMTEVGFRGYRILVPKNLREVPFTEACYKQKLQGEIRGNSYIMEYTLAFEASQPLPMGVLDNGRVADDMKYLAENYGTRIFRGYGSTAICRTETSAEFRKVMRTDLAEWKGWEAQMFCGTMGCYVVVLRRAYIPPLLDSYQYLIFTSFVQVKISQLQSEVDHTSEEELKKSLAPVMDAQPVASKAEDIFLQLKPKISEMNSAVERVAASVVPIEVCSKYYKQIVRLKKKAMLLLFDEVRYLQGLEQKARLAKKRLSLAIKGEVSTPMEPSEPDLGRLYAASVYSFMQAELKKVVQEREKLRSDIVPNPRSSLSVHSGVLNERKSVSSVNPLKKISTIRDKITDILSQLGCVVKAEFAAPEHVVDLIESTGMYANTSSNTEYNLVWQDKIANYLSAQLNIAPGPAESGLAILVSVVNNYLNKYKRAQGQKIVQYALHLRETRSLFTFGIPLHETLKAMMQRPEDYTSNVTVFAELIRCGLVAHVCNRMDSALYPDLAYKLLMTTANEALLSSIFEHLNSEPLERLIAAAETQTAHPEDAYLRLLVPCTKVLYSMNEELILQAIALISKLLRFKLSNDTEIWTFEFQSIVIRDLCRTGRSTVACGCLRILAFLLTMDSMPFMLSDPTLKLCETLEQLCIDVKNNPERFSGEDIYRLLVVCYLAGKYGSEYGHALMEAVAGKYAKLFASYSKSKYKEQIELLVRLFAVNLKRSLYGGTRKQDVPQMKVWRSIWNTFCPQESVLPGSFRGRSSAETTPQ